MKLIRKYDYVEEAESMARELEMRGIVTHISSSESQKLSRIFTGAFKVGLWAVLADQYEDAAKFVVDPSHQITSGLSAHEIDELEEQAAAITFEWMNNAILNGVLLIVLILGALYLMGLIR